MSRSIGASPSWESVGSTRSARSLPVPRHSNKRRSATGYGGGAGGPPPPIETVPSWESVGSGGGRVRPSSMMPTPPKSPGGGSYHGQHQQPQPAHYPPSIYRDLGAGSGARPSVNRDAGNVGGGRGDTGSNVCHHHNKNADVIKSLKDALEKSQRREADLAAELKQREREAPSPIDMPLGRRMVSPRSVAGMSPSADSDMPMDEAATILESQVLQLQEEVRRLRNGAAENEAASKARDEARAQRSENARLREQLALLQQRGGNGGGGPAAQASSLSPGRAPHSPGEGHSTRESSHSSSSPTLDPPECDSMINPLACDDETPIPNAVDVSLLPQTGQDDSFSTLDNASPVKDSRRMSRQTQDGMTEGQHHQDDRAVAAREQEKIRTAVAASFAKLNQALGSMLRKDGNNKDATAPPPVQSLSPEEVQLLDRMKKIMSTARERAMVSANNFERELRVVTSALNEAIQREEIVSEELEGKEQEAEKLAEALTKTMKALKAKNDEIDEIEDAHKSDMEEVEKELDKSEEEREGLAKRIEEMEVEHVKDIRAIQRVLADVTSSQEEKAKASSERIEELESEKAALEEELRKTTVAIAAATNMSEGAGLEGRVKELASLHDTAAKVPSLETELAKAKADLRQRATSEELLKRNVEQKTGRIETLEHELAAVRALLDDSDDEGGSESEKKILGEQSDKIVLLEKELEHFHTKLDEAEAKEKRLSRDIFGKEGEITNLENKNADVQTRLDVEMAKVVALSTELQEARATAAKEAAETLQKSKENEESTEMQVELDTLKKEHAESLAERETLRAELSKKSNSLETSKKIIASLESANGTILTDLRSKLKEKGTLVQTLQSKSDEYKKAVSSLEKELATLHRRNKETETAAKQARDRLRKQRSIHRQLKVSVEELRIARDGDEDEADWDVYEKMSEVLQRSLCMIEAEDEKGVKELEKVDEALARSAGRLKENISNADVDELKKQLQALKEEKESEISKLKCEAEEKDLKVTQLEEELEQIMEEMERLRAETERVQTEKQAGADEYQLEIQRLEYQCTANLEMLKKKEQELHVLRESLEDPSMGYVSDADDDEDDEDDETVSREVALYGQCDQPAQVVANLLVQSSNVEVPPPSADNETLRQQFQASQAEKEKAERRLQTERESLANAKMIISSLEKANKTMLEDLRSRLQDSNTAIASLLDKSMQNEKTTATLRLELEELRASKEEDEEEYQAEIKRMKDEGLVSSLRLAAKDREIRELRKEVKQSVSGDVLGYVEDGTGLVSGFATTIESTPPSSSSSSSGSSDEDPREEHADDIEDALVEENWDDTCKDDEEDSKGSSLSGERSTSSPQQHTKEQGEEVVHAQHHSATEIVDAIEVMM